MEDWSSRAVAALALVVLGLASVQALPVGTRTQGHHVSPIPLRTEGVAAFLQVADRFNKLRVGKRCGTRGFCPVATAQCCSKAMFCCPTKCIQGKGKQVQCASIPHTGTGDEGLSPKQIRDKMHRLIKKSEDLYYGKPFAHMSADVQFKPNNYKKPAILSELQSMTLDKCTAHLGGYLMHDRFAKQPRLNYTRAANAVAALAKLPGIQAQSMGMVDGYPVNLLTIQSHYDGAARILITAGIHGNEPVGVTAALEIAATLYQSPFRRYFTFDVVPMINIGGLQDNIRTLRSGVDPNRLFKPREFPGTMRKFEHFLLTNKHVMSLDLHGAKFRKGFFLIKASYDNGLGRESLSAIDKQLLLQSDSKKYPGYVGLGSDPRKYLLKVPGEATSNNPGTMKGFMFGAGTRDAYTLEYPGQMPVCTRQSGLVTLFMSFVGNFVKRHKKFN